MRRESGVSGGCSGLHHYAGRLLRHFWPLAASTCVEIMSAFSLAGRFWNCVGFVFAFPAGQAQSARGACLGQAIREDRKTEKGVGAREYATAP